MWVVRNIFVICTNIKKNFQFSSDCYRCVHWWHWYIHSSSDILTKYYFFVRLPIIQGGSHTFMAPIVVMMTLDQFKCPTDESRSKYTTLPATKKNKKKNKEINVEISIKISFAHLRGMVTVWADFSKRFFHWVACWLAFFLLIVRP